MKSLGATAHLPQQRVSPDRRDTGINDGVAPAQRALADGWRDPRLWLGVAMIAGSVVGGAKVLAAADDTTAVWAVESSVAPGDPITPDNLTPQRVRFVNDADRSRYFLASQDAPDGARITRAVGAGELLPRSALGTDVETGVIELPITVDAGRVPPSVGAGSIVDIWVAGEVAEAVEKPKSSKAKSSKSGASKSGLPGAVLTLDDVVVVEAPQTTEAFGAGGTRQLVLGVSAEQTELVASAVTAAATGDIVVTRQG
ncbi:MAG: SAF domain-containing protein [Nocardioides sp.]